MAPNGKISNLSNEEWRMVRSVEFKKNFGDWEIVARVEAIWNLSPVEIEIRNHSKENLFKIFKMLNLCAVLKVHR